MNYVLQATIKQHIYYEIENKNETYFFILMGINKAHAISLLTFTFEEQQYYNVTNFHLIIL